MDHLGSLLEHRLDNMDEVNDVPSNNFDVEHVDMPSSYFHVKHTDVPSTNFDVKHTHVPSIIFTIKPHAGRD